MNRPLKAALIGCGMIAGTHYLAMQSAGIEVVGVYSIDTAVALAFAKKYNICAYDSLNELLQDQIDLVSVCTPSGTHADLAISIMENEKYAVVEKPIALTNTECYRILQTEQKTGKFCVPISQLRFSDTYRTVKNAIDSESFGRILLSSLSMKYYRSSEYFAGSWHGTKSMDGGGALMNQGIHGIDMLCGLLGCPKQVSGHIATLHHNIEVEDTAVVSMVFPSGTLGVIDAGTAITYSKPRRLEICGTHASVTVEEDVLLSSEGISLNGGVPTAIRSWETPSAIGAELHTAQYRNICAAIRNEEALYYTAREATNTIKVVLAIYESSATGKTVILDI